MGHSHSNKQRPHEMPKSPERTQPQDQVYSCSSSHHPTLTEMVVIWIAAERNFQSQNQSVSGTFAFALGIFLNSIRGWRCRLPSMTLPLLVGLPADEAIVQAFVHEGSPLIASGLAPYKDLLSSHSARLVRRWLDASLSRLVICPDGFGRFPVVLPFHHEQAH